jgi:hypothetical protein
MKKVILCALVLAVSGVLVNSALAQETPRYLVTYVISSTSGTRSATVVTVVSQSSVSCDVQVEWFQAGSTFSRLVCTGKGTVVPGGVLHFCSRSLETGVSGGCNDFCDPEQTGFFTGKAIVSSSERFECSLLGIEARVLYTTGVDDNQIMAISNSKIVFFDEGNLGD